GVLGAAPASERAWGWGPTRIESACGPSERPEGSAAARRPRASARGGGAPRALKEEDKQMQVMCDNKELILGYVYDELPPGERQAFTDHVSGCPECQMELEEL